MLGWELGAETQAPEVSPGEKTGVGCVETAWWGIGTPQAEEWNATAEGTREKVWACRRGKGPLLGGWMHFTLLHGIPLQMCGPSEGTARHVKAMGSKKPLALAT